MNLKYICISALLTTLISTGYSSEQKGAVWSYEGKTGPQHWGSLSKDYSTCSTGKQQSPVNLDKSHLKTSTELTFSYKSSPFNLFDNGHTLQKNIVPGSFVTLNGIQYALKQFHYHTPSEHTINGEHYPMGIHFVHQSEKGEYLVVGVLVKEGKENSEYSKILTHKPKQKNQIIKPEETEIDLRKLLNTTTEYYEYEGSFTTPPCTEGVKWFVMVHPITLSKEQLEAFSRAHPKNNRSIQPLHGREIRGGPNN